MNMNRIAIIAVFLAALCALPALAGTSGALEGCVTDIRGFPVANVTVYASSPSQVAKTRTDASGHFVFVNLTPDTYTVTLERFRYAPKQVTGVTVQADQTQHFKTMLEWALIDPGPVRIDRASLLQRGIGSDLYRIYNGVPMRTPSEELRFVPGIQAGRGLPVTHR